jgi:hypothetical protein
MDANQLNSDHYSFLEGGLFRKAQKKFGIENHQGFLAVAGICFAWLPLVILTAIDGKLVTGATHTFLQDVAMHARILVAVPVLILIRRVIDIKTSAVTGYISESMLDADVRQKLLTVQLPWLRKLACSSWTEVVLLLIVASAVISVYHSGVYGGLQGVDSDWKFVGRPEENVLSLAGKWAVCISIPFFQFLLLQWLWRYMVWMMLLLHFSKLPLKLLPTHADRSGGLAIVMLAQQSLSFIFVAGSLVISGQLLVHLTNSPDNIMMVQRVAIGYILLSVFLLILPMLFFLGRLVRTKQLGLLRLSMLGTAMSKAFEQEWLNDKPVEQRIEAGLVDPSMAYDYSCMYDQLQQLRVLPVTIRDIISMVVGLALPFIPILFVYYSAAEVLQKILGFLV